ncbi:MAG: ribosome biogenesis GTPase Der [Gammaproteobacteria bacterium]|nr:ribosome biogenesis GTPase Der [Gammaproteobacteria bacterium]
MKPVIALVGRPNVGKSTLFNCLTRSRDALVADQPGLTRDRKYGEGRLGSKPFIVIDTGGLSGDEQNLDVKMAGQVWQAVEEADTVLFLVSAREGLSSQDHEIATQLRPFNKRVQLVVNKIDGTNPDVSVSEFYALGLGDPIGITASHGGGVTSLIEAVLQDVPDEDDLEGENEDAGIRIAIVGKPNVGKSTLVNRLLGEDRVLALDMPGTTRDSIFIPFERDGKKFTLIDTAGVRRKSKIDDKLEKFSVIKALQAVEAANVVLMVVDAREGISDQDAHLLGFVLDAGKALVIAVNKWDGLAADERDQVKSELQRRLQFADFAEIHFISALHGSGVGKLYKPIEQAYRSAFIDVSTSELTTLLENAVTAHQPQLVKGRRIKLRYAHQGGRNPPRIIIHGNQVDKVPSHYQRYLSNFFRKALRLQGTPLRIEFKSGHNPFEGKRNTLTPRQIRSKKRLRKFVKKNR